MFKDPLVLIAFFLSVFILSVSVGMILFTLYEILYIGIKNLINEIGFYKNRRFYLKSREHFKERLNQIGQNPTQSSGLPPPGGPPPQSGPHKPSPFSGMNLNNFDYEFDFTSTDALSLLELIRPKIKFIEDEIKFGGLTPEQRGECNTTLLVLKYIASECERLI